MGGSAFHHIFNVSTVSLKLDSLNIVQAVYLQKCGFTKVTNSDWERRRHKSHVYVTKILLFFLFLTYLHASVPSSVARLAVLAQTDFGVQHPGGS